jgi:hypothetical protein
MVHVATLSLLSKKDHVPFSVTLSFRGRSHSIRASPTEATQMERPFASVRAENVYGTTASGMTHRDRAVRCDANPTHIFAWNASRRTLRERAK